MVHPHYTLSKLQKKIEKLIVKREENYSKRTKNWQNSDVGAVYKSDTKTLYQVKDDLKNAILSLEKIKNCRF